MEKIKVNDIERKFLSLFASVNDVEQRFILKFLALTAARGVGFLEEVENAINGNDQSIKSIVEYVEGCEL